jgi:thioredoxin 1
MLNESEQSNIRNGALPVIGAASFTSEVLTSTLPVLVAFWSPWSRPCQVSDSVLQEIAHEWTGKIKVVKVNADDSLDLSLGYEIRFVPTLLYFIGGKPCERIVGTASKEAILAKLKLLAE